MKRNQFLYIFVICALLGTILGYRKSLEAGGYTQVLDSPVIAAIPPNPIINSTLAGGLDSEYVTDMAIGPDGSIYVCGYTSRRIRRYFLWHAILGFLCLQIES